MLAGALVVSATGPPSGAEGNEAPGNPFAFRAIAAGTSHTCVLVHDATVKCWGLNASGQLGQGSTTTRGDGFGEMGDDLVAVDLGVGRTATAITAGASHTCALLDNATVKCWGLNTNGQLGLGDTAARGDAPGEMGNLLPAVSLGTGRTATAITAGANHTCALLDDATVKCWGQNTNGRLGLGDNAARGDAAGEMGNSLPAVSLGTGRTATAITAGTNHTCALLDSAAVKCWGSNTGGQLGLGDTAARGDAAGEMGNSLPAVSLGTGRTATAVSAGISFTCAVLDNATVKCWGNNATGQLGLGDTVLRGDNAGEMGNSLPAVNLGAGRTATGVSASTGASACAVLDNATLKCWGNNATGQLGLGDTANRGDAAGEMGDSLPAVSLGTGRTARGATSGDAHSCARLDNATVKCWGFNASGQLGLGTTTTRGDGAGEMGESLPAISLGSTRTATRVASGHDHVCASLDTGTLQCWGEASAGQLGSGDTVDRGDAPGEMGDALAPTSLGTGRTVVVIGSGTAHSCAVLDNATLKCWGSNAAGELGLGDTAARGDGAGEMGNALPAVNLGTGRTATAVDGGSGFTCALLDNASVKCWGQNNFGQLGLGDTAVRGDAGGEMGNSLPTVSLGTGRTATAIAVGDAHACALLDNAGVKCWGLNNGGRLGLGDTDNRGDGAGEMGDALSAVNLGSGRTATAIAAGGGLTCARLDNGSLKCWGLNAAGQLGLGDTNSRGDGPGEMGDNLPAIALGTGRTALAVSTGFTHTCALLDNHKVKCWGQNSSGQLGLGDTASRGDAAGEMGDNLPAADLGAGRTAGALTSGVSFNCARLDNGTVKCWGNNTSGHLGLGDTAARGDAAGEMGDALLPVDLGSASPSGVSGSITDAVSGLPVSNANVLALHTDDFTIAAGVLAEGNGAYELALPPGDYFLYLIDRSGAHNAGFFGPPTTVTVPADAFADADPTMTPTRGAITGTVTQTAPVAPVAGAWALAQSAGGVPERGVVANGSGTFTINGLNPGNHAMVYLDPAGGHVSRFFPSAPTFPGTLVPVTPGGSAVANGSVPAQTSAGAGSLLSGSVTESGTGTPVSSVFVFALNGSDFSLARGTVSSASGAYNLNLVPGASYKLGFIDSLGRHNMEWHDNQPGTNLGGAVSVVSPAVIDAALDRSTGSLSGTVIDSASFAPLSGAWVFAIGPTGIAGGTVTALNGTYNITSLAPGTYRVLFVDPIGRRSVEYWDGAPDFATADTLNITAGANIINVDGALAVP